MLSMGLIHWELFLFLFFPHQSDGSKTIFCEYCNIMQADTVQ